MKPALALVVLVALDFTILGYVAEQLYHMVLRGRVVSLNGRLQQIPA